MKNTKVFTCKLSFVNHSKCIQSTPDNSNLQGKSKTVRVVGSSKKIAESKVKTGEGKRRNEFAEWHVAWLAE